MQQPLPHDSVVTFADVAHQYVSFDSSEPSGSLVLKLIDTPWFQRLRDVRQTGNTNLVYMFAEHSRFGHSIGVAYLASLLMKKLSVHQAEKVAPFQMAVTAAALLHDIGHVAPGSHLAERIWSTNGKIKHEHVSIRVVQEDPVVHAILREFDANLPSLVTSILSGDPSLPAWTKQIISGGGWNADRGNWAIVDSAMCAVHYGRYNVAALIDAFCLSDDGQLVLLESRVDALSHFFVARDSMYRQVYQHRVLQSADILSAKLILRLRDIATEANNTDLPKESLHSYFESRGILADNTMLELLLSADYSRELSLPSLFRMTESWWRYHLDDWTHAQDPVLSDLARRLRDRDLFKTIRIEHAEDPLVASATACAQKMALDPRYYVSVVDNADKHRLDEDIPCILKENGILLPVTEIEPMIAHMNQRRPLGRRWLAVPKSIKAALGKYR